MSDHSTTRAAYERIRQAIVEGHYRPGARLVEQRLADELNLASRTPVREALRMLESDGLVRTEPNRGAVVSSLSLAEISDLYELRSRLEGYAAELAAQRATETQLQLLDEAVAAFDATVPAARSGVLEGLREVNQANRRFHDTVLAAAAHDRLIQLRVRTVDLPLVFEAFRRFHRPELDRSSLFHHLIRNAIADRDGARAGRLMNEHILQGR
ncbi:MAG: GntR family transcriptional regulator, partial [Ilumatobacteraceae bacterium]